MKKFLLTLLLGIGLHSISQAQVVTTISTNIGAFRTINLVSNDAQIYSIVAVNTNTVGTNTVFYLFDSGLTNTYYTNAPYTNIARIVDFATNIFTNVLGVAWTNRYPAILIQTTVVSTPLTNFFPIVYSATVASNNGSITYSPTAPFRVFNGITISNAQSAVNLTITYAQ